MPWTDSIYVAANTFHSVAAYRYDPAWKSLANGRSHLRLKYYNPNGTDVAVAGTKNYADSHGCYDGTYLWFPQSRDTQDTMGGLQPLLWRFNPITGALDSVGLLTANRKAYNCVAYNGTIYVLGFELGRVGRINATTLASSPAVFLNDGATYGSQMCVANGYLWIPEGNAGVGTIQYVNLATATPGKITGLTATQLYAAFYDGARVYVSSNQSSALVSFNPDPATPDIKYHTLTPFVATSAVPETIASDGTYLYITGYSGSAPGSYVTRWDKVGDDSGGAIAASHFKTATLSDASLVVDIKISGNQLYIPHEGANSLVDILSLDLSRMTTVTLSRNTAGKAIHVLPVNDLIYVFCFDGISCPFTFASFSGAIRA